MKNAKKLTRAQKKFLNGKGFETGCYLAIKNTPDFLEIYNKETGETCEVRRR